MSLHTHRGGWCGREREAGLSPGGGGGGASPTRCLPAAVPEPLLLLGCCLRPQDPAEPGRGERGRLLAAAEMMAEGGGGPARRKALSLLEAARSRYESLQISDDVFGESGQDSSGNPFYSTSADSRSAASSQDEDDDEEDQGRLAVSSPRSRAARRRAPRAAATPAERRRQRQVCGGSAVPGGPGPMEEEEEEEEAERGGWTRSLRDVPPPHFKDGSGTRRAGCRGRGRRARAAVGMPARGARSGVATGEKPVHGPGCRLGCCPAPGLAGGARQVPPALSSLFPGAAPLSGRWCPGPGAPGLESPAEAVSGRARRGRVCLVTGFPSRAGLWPCPERRQRRVPRGMSTGAAPSRVGVRAPAVAPLRCAAGSSSPLAAGESRGSPALRCALGLWDWNWDSPWLQGFLCSRLQT